MQSIVFMGVSLVGLPFWFCLVLVIIIIVLLLLWFSYCSGLFVAPVWLLLRLSLCFFLNGFGSLVLLIFYMRDIRGSLKNNVPF